MKDKIQIGLLVVIAAALVYLAVSRSGGTTDAADATGTADAATATSANPATLAANTVDASKAIDPMAQAEQAAIDNRPKTTVSFGSSADYEHDFGNVKQDTQNKHVFKFTNTGSEPLIIESATGSCGCTVPSYPKEPIAPGAQGQIEVVYSPGKQENAQQKQVTVVANTEPKQTILRIKANVQKDPNAPATPAAGGGH